MFKRFLLFAIVLVPILQMGCGSPPETLGRKVSAVSGSASFETEPLFATNFSLHLIEAAQRFTLPPQPLNPSSTAHYVQQFQTHQQADASQGMYLAIETGSVFIVGQGWQRAYTVEVVGNNRSGAGLQDPIVSAYAYSGDTITYWWHGPGDTYSVAHGAEYFELLNDNGSGRGAPGWPSDRHIVYNYVAPPMDAVLGPNVTMTVDTAWNKTIPTLKHTCWGDGPAAVISPNGSRQEFLDYVVTADGSLRYVFFGPPTSPGAPTLVDYNGNSIPGCNLVSQHITVSGEQHSLITSYGGQ